MLWRPEPHKSSCSLCSSIPDDQGIKALSNKRTITGCFDSGTSESVTKPLRHLARQEGGSRGLGAHDGPGATAGLGGRSWSHETHDGPRAVLCQETEARDMRHVAVPELLQALLAGARATRHMTAPELPYTRRQEPQDTQACAPVLSFVFDLKLVREGIQGPGGTDTS
jgi:hypothetical protein